MSLMPALLLDKISEGILILDTEGYILESNQSATAITGFSSEQLKGKPLSVLYPDPRESIRTDYELSQAVKTGSFITETMRVRQDQSPYWLWMSIMPLFKPEGALQGFVCELRDITAQKKNEQDIKTSEERYRLLVEGVRDYAIFMLDPSGKISTWNEGARRITGYTAPEVTGKHFSIFYTAEDKTNGKFDREMQTAREKGKYEEEGWRVKKNGSVYWADVVLTSLFDRRNNLIGFSKVTRDLTDRKEREEQLRQSEERYRSLVEQVRDYAIFLLDETGRVASWNEGARRTKGYDASEIIGKHFSIFYSDEDIINGKPPMELEVAIRDGKYEEEGWRIKKDGSRFWASVLITPVYSSSGQMIGFSKVTRDLTERKAAENALRESYKQYRELADQLRVTNEELSYTNQELEQFTSIVSHDLQEPIRTIKSFLLLIEQQIKAGKYENLHAYISKSVNAAGRMRVLIQSLLHYSQLSKDQLEEEKVDMHELISLVLQDMKSSIDRSNATITLSLHLRHVLGDRVQLQQLLQNLVGNALKFTDERNPIVMISSQPAENHFVRFSISDNGIGIKKEDLGKVFDIFKRLDTRKEYPGTGIGLAICKRIVDRHGGQIWAESETGQGTTFHFTLKTPHD